MDGLADAKLTDDTREILRSEYSLSAGALFEHEGDLFPAAVAYAKTNDGNGYDAASMFMAELVSRAERGLIGEDTAIFDAPGTAIRLHRNMRRVDLFDPLWMAALEGQASPTATS